MDLQPSRATGRFGQLSLVELVMLTLGRTILTIAYRMLYPFLTVFSRGLGVRPESLRLLIGVRSAMGFASPLFGPFSDRFGRRAMLLAGLSLLTLSLLAVPIWPVWGVVFPALVLTGLAKIIYDPAMQAYVGDRVPYNRRGLAIGVTELSWSAGLLLGAPLVGLIIARAGWQAPFALIAALAFLSLLAIFTLLPRDAGVSSGLRRGFGSAWGLLLRSPVALGILLVFLLLGLANEVIFVVYGEWMEGSFGLPVTGLGLLTAVIGVAELGAEAIVIGGSDRLGKRRLVMAGTALAALCYVALPRLGTDLPRALAMLFVVFIGFEVSIVAFLPMITEALPEARGTMMATSVMAISGGRTLGALLGSGLWNLGGFALSGLAAGLINCVALLVIVLFVTESHMGAGEVPDAPG